MTLSRGGAMCAGRCPLTLRWPKRRLGARTPCVAFSDVRVAWQADPAQRGRLVVDQGLVTRAVEDDTGQVEALAIHEITYGKGPQVWFKMGESGWDVIAD